jgi:23S rRNA (cytosine1962-C5)-methyltransferase
MPPGIRFFLPSAPPHPTFALMRRWNPMPRQTPPPRSSARPSKPKRSSSFERSASPYSSSKSPASAKPARSSPPSPKSSQPLPSSPQPRSSFPSSRPPSSKPRSPSDPLPVRKLPHIDPPDYVHSSPAAIIAHRAGERLVHGHLWVYRTDIEELVPTKSEDIPPGALLRVLDRRNKFYGTALYSAASQITLRLFSPDELPDRDSFLSLLEQRIAAAVARRLPLLSASTDSARLVFSEADQLPGLVIDRYNDLVLVQILTQGFDFPDVRESITRSLLQSLAPEFSDSHFRPRAILERPDPRIRVLEQLPVPSQEPLYLASPILRADAEGHSAYQHHAEIAADPPHAPTEHEATVFSLNGLRFHYDASAGQKTGAFLDQRDNYAAAAFYAATAPPTSSAERAALDVCCYQGGFALHLARAGCRVTGVDSSRAALEVAERNLELNRDNIPDLRDAPQSSSEAMHSGELSNPDWIEADAFTLLRDFASQGQQFSIIVLDPPAFAKSKRAADSALRGYKELNLRALQMLVPGGILLTCSCSHHVSLEAFTAVVADAAADAGRRVTLLETRTAAPDHPVILTLPETHYLKCLICRVD